MRSTRRLFLKEAVGFSAGAGWVSAMAQPASSVGDTPPDEPDAGFKLVSIGKVENKPGGVRLRIFDRYADALLGLEEWSHVNVLYWFDRNDVPAKRRILRVHPRGNRDNPLTGVFACRSPVRPNLIALTVCKIRSVKEAVVTIDRIDAWDGTPILDLKPFISPNVPKEELRFPEWTGRKR